MEQITEHNIVSLLLKEIPDIEPYYKKECDSWDEDGEQPSAYDVFSFVVNDYLEDLLKSGKEEEKLKKLFAFFERVEEFGNHYVQEMQTVTVFEHITGNDLFYEVEKYMGPKSIQSAKENADFWGHLPKEWPQPLKRRRVLAVFIDFLLFSAVLGLIGYFSGITTQPFWMQLVAFSVLETILLRFIVSPGYWLLSVYRYDDKEKFESKLVVNPVIKRAETWLTMLLGVHFILSGCKSLVRWTQGLPIFPVFGVELSYPIDIIFTCVAGLVAILVGSGYLRLKRIAFWLALGMTILGFVDLYLNWDMLPNFIEYYTIVRRDIQGIPLRPGEVENARIMMPKIAIGFLSLQFIAILAVRKRMFF